MQRFVLLFVLGLIAATTTQLTAQTTDLFASKGLSASTSSLEDWEFFTDDAQHIYYIDFESLKVNLSYIMVRDEQGNVVMEDNVQDLPVNTIYELDFDLFGKGTYYVELLSFTDQTSRKVVIE